MMRPLVPAMATKATAAAVAGIKRPWVRSRAAMMGAVGAGPSMTDSTGGSGLALVKGKVPAARMDSNPPMGYLWLWMGNFRRWQRRFFVASEAPGVLLIYKRMNMKGKVSSISLRGARVEEDASDARQLKIVTNTGLIFLRCIVPEERTRWLACLQESIQLYARNQLMVEELKDKGLLPQQVLPGGAESGVGGPLGAAAMALPEVADMDVEQRRRIRALMAERLSEIVPFQQEVERHMAGLSAQLLGVVSGLNIRLPALTPSNSVLRLTSTSLGTPRVPATHSHLGVHAAHLSTDAGMAPIPDLPETEEVEPASAGVLPLPVPPKQHSEPATGAATPKPHLEHGNSFAHSSLLARMRSRNSRSGNLQQAYAQLLEAVRHSLHMEAVRIVQLESENLALQKTISVFKTQAQRTVKRTRSDAGALGSGTADRASVRPGLAQVVGSCDEGGSSGDDDDDASVRTADEDAFDVTEAFDDGVDYSILDVADAPMAGEERRRSPKRSATPAGAGEEGEDEDEDDEDEGCSEAEAVEVLNALEVVRQVEYVEGSGQKFAEAITTQEPPDKAPVDGALTDVPDEDDDDEEGAQAGAVRTRLPAPRPLGKGFSIWSLLKNMIGKDLTRLTMPATINEPTSTLQRLAESVEYSCLLDKASEEPLAVDRMMLVALWNLTCYNSQALRDGKPFNPLLGETYEWQAPDGRTRYVCEQVSHHPPVLAYVADSTEFGWEMQGELETKSKFWGKSAEVVLWGCEGVRFKGHGEEYRWNRATICVHDVLLGNYWIEVYGKVKVVNTATGEVAQLTLKPCRRRLADRGKVEGSVFDAQGNEVWTISGSTADHLYATLTPAGAKLRAQAAAAAGPTMAKSWVSAQLEAAGAAADEPPAQPVCFWSKDPYPEDAAAQYWFTRFAIGLNDPGDPIASRLPPTDSRFRPDQRSLEVGEWTRATTEKLRLEEKQRQARRERAKVGVEYEPCWFRQADATTLTRLPEQGGFAWAFTGEYWRRRAAKDWATSPDLYSTADTVIIPKLGAQPPSP